jgi:hypothetical protein
VALKAAASLALCSGLGIAWQYEPRRFHLKTCTYLPDFYLPTEGVYWELKGWFNDRSKTAITEFRELYPEIPLVLANGDVLLMLERAARDAA